MSIKKKGRETIYPDNFKVAIAREHLTGNLGYSALGKKYKLSKATVVYFIQWYREHYPQDTSITDPVNTPAPGIKPADLASQLKEANLKIAALEMLIATAQKELGIDILKKPGTKQSSK